MVTTTAHYGVSPPTSSGLSAASIAGFVALAMASCLCALLLLYYVCLRMNNRHLATRFRSRPPVPGKDHHVAVPSAGPISRQKTDVLPTSAPRKPSLSPRWPEGHGRYGAREPAIAFPCTEAALATYAAVLESPMNRQSLFQATHQHLRRVGPDPENAWPRPLQPRRIKMECIPERRPWPGSSRASSSSWYSRTSSCWAVFEEDLAESLERELGANPGPTIRSVQAAARNYVVTQPTRPREDQHGVLSMGGIDGR